PYRAQPRCQLAPRPQTAAQVPLDEMWPVLTQGKQSPVSLAEKHSEEEALRAVISTLPAERQLVLTLKFGESKSNEEIGRALGRSEGAIKSLFHRTLEEMRQEMT